MIQLLKSVSAKSFVSTEAAHSTAAFQPVKLFLKNFSFLLNRLRFRAKLLLVSGRRILQRYKPLSTTSFNRLRSVRPKHQQSSTTTLPARRILLESAIRSTSFFVQPFDFQRVFREDCTGSGAHYRPDFYPVNRFFEHSPGFQRNTRKGLLAGPGRAAEKSTIASTKALTIRKEKQHLRTMNTAEALNGIANPAAQH